MSAPGIAQFLLSNKSSNTAVGRTLTLKAGDVAILPAGKQGHRRLLVFSSRRACLHALAFPEVLQQLLKGEAVENARRGHTAFARHLDAPMGQIDLAGRMR